MEDTVYFMSLQCCKCNKRIHAMFYDKRVNTGKVYCKDCYNTMEYDGHFKTFDALWWYHE